MRSLAELIARLFAGVERSTASRSDMLLAEVSNIGDTQQAETDVEFSGEII